MRTWLAPARWLAWLALAAPGAALADGITGAVFVAPGLEDQVRVGDTVFIVASAPRAGRMPVAVLRLQVRSLPVRFTLDDSNALAPELTLSRYPLVSVEARISRSGDVIRQRGDLYSRPVSASAGRGDLYLLIDQVFR